MNRKEYTAPKELHSDSNPGYSTGKFSRIFDESCIWERIEENSGYPPWPDPDQKWCSEERDFLTIQLLEAVKSMTKELIGRLCK